MQAGATIVCCWFVIVLEPQKNAYCCVDTATTSLPVCSVCCARRHQ